MVNMTLALPEELHSKMKRFSEIKWAEVARRAMQEKIADLEEMNKMLVRSKISKKDADRVSENIKRSAAKKF